MDIPRLKNLIIHNKKYIYIYGKTKMDGFECIIPVDKK